jgi:hypothetical protein
LKLLMSDLFLNVCCTTLLLISVSDVALAQNGGQTEQAKPLTVAPLTTTFTLNGTSLRYGVDSFAELGATIGEGREDLPLLNFTDVLSETLVEKTENRVFHRRQTGTYVQLGTVVDSHRVATIRSEAVDLIGETIQLSITGRCMLPGSDPDAYCSYTPNIASNDDYLDEMTLLPSNFDVRSDFGATISQSTHDSLKSEGFQQTGADGEAVGLLVDLPNAGLTYSTARSELNKITRHEDSRARLVPSFATVEQNLYSNDTSAALSRTIRGGVFLKQDEWTSTAAAFQALAWILPSHDASLSAGENNPQLSISNNLFYAANNIRVPERSFTVYQGISAQGDHSRTPPTRASETPVVWAKGIWLGFSPVSEFSRSTELAYIPTGNRQVVREAFQQGGANFDLDTEITGRISVLDISTQELAQIDITNIEDLFVQSGAILTTQDAIRRITTNETYTYSYVPHLSVSGNRTDGTSVLRYYTGVILAKEENAYAGFDYVLKSEDGLQAGLGATLYSEPTRDYYSQAQASLSKQFELPAGQLTMGLSGSTEIEKTETHGILDPIKNNNNLIDLTATYREGPAVLSVRQRATEIGNDDPKTSTTLSYAYRFSSSLSANYEVTPLSSEDSYFIARAGFSYMFPETAGNSVLNVQWSRIRYDYGEDNVGGSLTDAETTFFATLKMTF